MLSSYGVPDDDRKARRFGDDTKGRIADLASGWTVGDADSVPEPAAMREPSGPARSADAVRRAKVKSQPPPPPPGSHVRKALEEKILELRSVYSAEDAPKAAPRSAAPARNGGGNKPRTLREEPIDLAAIAESDKTKENRGAVGIKHDRSPSISTNAASGTIGGDTPPPIFDRAAIAAGQRARAAERAADGPSARLGSPPGDALRADPGTIKAPAPTGAITAPRPSPRASGSDRLTAPPAAEGAITLVHPSRRSDELGRGSAPVDAVSRLAVPVGEFDHRRPGEHDRSRANHSQQVTVTRDAPNGPIYGSDPPSPSSVLIRIEDDSGQIATARLEDPTRLELAPAPPAGGLDDSGILDSRGDVTTHAPPQATPVVSLSGTLRPPAALRRRRGAVGDLQYILTVVSGLRDARRELADLTTKQATRQQSRRRHLVTLGRAAVAAARLEHPALGEARRELAAVEDERSQHAGHVVAADAELIRVRREREARAAHYLSEIAAIDGELSVVAKQLEPLHKEVGGIKKRGGELHDALRRIDAKIAATEARLGQAKGGQGKTAKLDPAALQAELATWKADRKAIQRDEPVIAGQLDALSPRIAALEAARSEAQRKRVELEAAERDDQRRAEELLAAIGAKRKVVDRSTADAETRRDKLLFQLGERLYVDRPVDLTGELAPIDEIDLELGSADRRLMELREILVSVDRWKLARGVGLLLILLGAVGGLATLAVWLFHAT